jgi:hypothetical protein
MFKCPHCGKWTELIFPDCLVITADDYLDTKIYDSHYICKECKGILKNEEKSEWLKKYEWVPSFTNRVVEGYHIPQLYSMAKGGRPYMLATQYLKGLTNTADEQEFYNSKLGLPHEPEGSKVTEKNLIDCIGGHIKTDKSPPNSLVTMGVDVGRWLHYEICQWFVDRKSPIIDLNLSVSARLLYEGKIQHFEELDMLMRQYNVAFCVVDSQPERRKAYEFAKRFWGIVKLCTFVRGISGKMISMQATEEQSIHCDRTAWMDIALGRFRNKKIILPKDLSNEYKEHIKAPVRITKKDTDDNPIGRYVKSDNAADHFALARTYCELALALSAGLAESKDIRSVL